MGWKCPKCKKVYKDKVYLCTKCGVLTNKTGLTLAGLPDENPLRRRR